MKSTKYSCVRPLFLVDCYKISHYQQYALSGRLDHVYSNFTCRKSRLPWATSHIHFGLQYAIQRYLDDEWQPFFAADVDEVCALYSERVSAIVGQRPPTAHIRAVHALGYLPLKICGAPEGTRLPFGVPSWTIENTIEGPEYSWLVNYVETIMSCATWIGGTSATTSAEYRRRLEIFAQNTGVSPQFVDWQAHDFSFRGMASPDAAELSGAAHLLSFNGSDSLCALDFVDRYYGGGAVLGSVPATEHSIMSSGIARVGEQETFRRLLNFYLSGIVSIVSDTFDLWRVLTEYLPALKNEVLARDGKCVIRPDSSDPETILCGDASATYGSPQYLGVIHLLAREFGTVVNDKGYLHLNPKVGAIYGDSITLERATSILTRLQDMGFASDVIVFGVGSFTFQHVTRDTLGSAIKATQVVFDGQPYDIQKDPVTDNGTKKSATGRLAVIHCEQTKYRLIQRATPEQEARSVLQPVWADGKFIRFEKWPDIVRRVRC